VLSPVPMFFLAAAASATPASAPLRSSFWWPSMSKATSPLLLPEDARPSDTLKLRIAMYFHVCLIEYHFLRLAAFRVQGHVEFAAAGGGASGGHAQLMGEK